MDTEELLNYLTSATSNLQGTTYTLQQDMNALRQTIDCESVTDRFNELEGSIDSLFSMMSKVLYKQYEGKYIVLAIRKEDEDILKTVYGFEHKKQYLGKFLRVERIERYRADTLDYAVIGETGMCYLSKLAFDHIDFITFDDPDTAKLYAECAD